MQYIYIYNFDISFENFYLLKMKIILTEAPNKKPHVYIFLCSFYLSP